MAYVLFIIEIRFLWNSHLTKKKRNEQTNGSFHLIRKSPPRHLSHRSPPSSFHSSRQVHAVTLKLAGLPPRAPGFQSHSWRFSSGFPILKMECHPGGDWHPGWGVVPTYSLIENWLFFVSASYVSFTGGFFSRLMSWELITTQLESWFSGFDSTELENVGEKIGSSLPK